MFSIPSGAPLWAWQSSESGLRFVTLETGTSSQSGHLSPGQSKLRTQEVIVVVLAAVGLLGASYFELWSISLVEAWGFSTGIACVWLVVREHLLNWPIGLANNVFFFILFFRSQLYADMGLQVVYLGLGIYGWLNWIYGGKRGSLLLVTRTSGIEWIGVLAVVPVGTWALREVLLAVNGAAPFWDSLTTVLCLVAQYLLCRKRLENWFFWIAADLIYVPLYLSRDLPLTSVLYGLFLVLCFVGLQQWLKSYRRGPATNEI